ncbi:MAG: sigma-70 family RNA polymerase sigma factor [Actinomycetia bacterium]|nr:sigma-70 family RNA polymerase sigma factor [Actinomycetes bacterium]MCP4962832.1 sigma-70 family RNA polymerase sigma factor [Actinomycetes bacterium]
MADDDELVSRARGGDRTALDTLLRRHHDRIYAICRRIAGNDADAADATQDALIAVVRRLDRFDGRSTFSTWSYRVATNACLDELRRRRRRPDPTDLDERDTPHEPDDFTTRHALADEIGQALDSIPENFRLPVVMRDIDDLDYAEISELLGVPMGTVKSRIARGRSMLANILGTNRPTPDVKPDDHV